VLLEEKLKNKTKQSVSSGLRGSLWLCQKVPTTLDILSSSLINLDNRESFFLQLWHTYDIVCFVLWEEEKVTLKLK